MNPQSMLQKIKTNIEDVLVGKPAAIDLVLCALCCRGHVLIEDVPGIGKTTLVSALADSLGCSFQRIQFTPDVMPSDITGFSIADFNTGRFEYHEGAIMHQIILADEINRTSPKTQSSLLEVMQENQVTVDGKTYRVPLPFMVLATQNPVEYVGTYPLPEAQLDRFMMKISLGYPGIREEVSILDRHDRNVRHDAKVEPVVSAKDVLELQEKVDGVFCSPALKEYIAQIAANSRVSADVLLGVSPRGTIALMLAAKGWAMLSSREFVLPDDVLRMAPYVLSHRLQLKPEARLQGLTPERVLSNIMRQIKLPDSL